MTESSEYLYTIRPTRLEMLTEGRTPDEAQILSDHFAYLEDLAARWIVLLAGRTQENDGSTFGIVILQAESLEDAREIMNNDPAIQGGVMSATLHPFSVSVEARR